MKNILFKLFIFLLALIAVCFGVSRILNGEQQIVEIADKTLVVLSILTVADLTAFFIQLLILHCKWKKNWISFCSLLIAAFGLAVILILLIYLLPDFPIAARIAYSLFELTVLASAVNLICNIFYAIFGNEKIKVRWKLFIFFMVIKGICTGLLLIASALELEIIKSVTLSIGLLSLSAAVINLLVIIAASIFSRNTNIFFKIFIFSLIFSGIIAAYSFLPLFLGYPIIQRQIFIAAIAVFLFAVMVLIVNLFRTIFLDKPFMRSDIKKNIPQNNGNAELTVNSGTESEMFVSTLDSNTNQEANDNNSWS